MKDPFLVGSSIYLRLHRLSDVGTWYSWFNDGDVTRFLEQSYYPNTRQEQLKRFKQMYTTSDKKNLQLAVVEKKSNRLVGTAGLHQINMFNRNADISVVIGNKKAWGKHYGEQAVSLLVEHGFSKMNLHKITAGMAANNTASYRLFRRLGFKREAVLKEQLFVNGKLQDAFRLALFKKHWNPSRAKRR